MNKTPHRRQQILEALAGMLESSPGQRITTAKLAAEVGVSEAALYRHYPSKARMFEGLMEFMEEAVISRANRISRESMPALHKCENILTLLLMFTERNPGITRLLHGDALTGETERLRDRINQFYDRLETQLRQILRQAEMDEGLRCAQPANTCAQLLLAAAEGRVSQFVRSDFKRPPTENWADQWQLLSAGLFRNKDQG